VRYCSLTYRMLVLSGRWDEARSLAYDMKDELRDAARRLYHAGGEYLLVSLDYLNAWLEIEPQDRYSRWFKARCLTRLERYEEAERELRVLEDGGYHPYLVCHARGLMLRDQGKLEEAALTFRKGLDDRPDFPPLLRDLGDVLERMGDREGAVRVLGRAYDLQPADAYVVSRYAETLQAVGRIPEALDVTRGALSASPEEPSLLHRMSMLLCDAGEEDEARSCGEKAVALNPSLTEAVLHLAAMEIRAGEIERGEARLQGLPARIPKHLRRARDTALAEQQLRRGDTEAARDLIGRYDPLSDSFCAALSIRIGTAQASRALAAGNHHLALAIARETKRVADQALAKFADSGWIRKAADALDRLARQLDQ
jgi:tetratricopeptide (TPR) repeat protein